MHFPFKVGDWVSWYIRPEVQDPEHVCSYVKDVDRIHGIVRSVHVTHVTVEALAPSVGSEASIRYAVDWNNPSLRLECGAKPGKEAKMIVREEWIELAREIGQLVAEKNAAYGDSVRKSAKIMQTLYPEGIKFDQIPASLVTVRILDKLCRIANDPKYGGEDPASDITGYGLLLRELVKNGL